MDYEDFIEGYKPVSDTDGEQSGGGVRYEVVSGIFQQCCLDAKVKEIMMYLDAYLSNFCVNINKVIYVKNSCSRY